MSIGKLYRLGDDQLVAHINYHLFEYEAAENWWGELTLYDHASLNEGDVFIIELEDKRKSRCHLKKRVNRAVSGIPPRYIYHVKGISLIE
ncbi:MAG TPA: hypothetical protein VMW37_01265 [Dehalococcoidales bacterium]|nr:hypothetical protein [Dehalococcoidales bacterium]